MIWGTEGRHMWVPKGLADVFTVAQLVAGSYATDLYAYIRSLVPSIYWTMDAAHGVTDQSVNGRNGTGQGGITIGAAASLTADPAGSSTNFDGDTITPDRVESTYAPHASAGVRTYCGRALGLGYGAGRKPLFVLGANSVFQVGLDTTFRATFSGSIASITYTWPAAFAPLDEPFTWALKYDPQATTQAAELFINGASQGFGIHSPTGFAAGTSTDPFFVGSSGIGATPIASWQGQQSHAFVVHRGLTAAEIAVVDFLASTYPVEPPLTLNRRIDDSGAIVFPRYKVRKISGLGGGGDSADTRDARVGAQGEIPRRSFRRGKTITYEGQVQAQTRAALRTAEQLLNDAFDDQSGEGLMIVTPHPLYDASGAYRYFRARAISCEIDDGPPPSPGRTTLGHESPFVVALRNARAGGVSYRDQAGATYK